MSIKICHITSMHDWDDDRIYQRACLGLAREGMEVHLVAQKSSNSSSNTDVNFHWLQMRAGWKRRWYSSKEAIKIAINIKADIYHFHDPDLLPHILKIKKLLPNSYIIYDIHENYAGRFKNWGLPDFLGTIFRWYEKRKIKKIDGFSVVSSSMNSLFNGVKTPSVLIRNSTDISRLSKLKLTKIEKFKEAVIYTSGTNSNARNCIQTVASLKYIETKDNFSMMFAGMYETGIEDKMTKLARSDNTEHLLNLEGMLPWEENFKRTAKAFCGCVFYEDNANNRVGIPNRLFEYMYCGLPIIATDFPELKKIIEDTKCGILVDSENPKSIAEGFTYLLNNPLEANAMGERGRLAIENTYGYHVDLKNMIDFYSSLIKES